jgi:phosphoglycerate dehydrogenase-like enzyme
MLFLADRQRRRPTSLQKDRPDMLRCAVLDDYQDAAMRMADWAPLAGKVEVKIFRNHMTSEEEVAAAIADCEIVVIMRERTPFGASLFARLPRLKILITSGMRNGSIDLKAAAHHNVIVCGTGSGSSPPAEMTWALILGLARRIAPENAALRSNGPWQSTVGSDLEGKQLGVIGLGKIGERVAKVGLAFNMKVAAWSSNLTAERAAEVGVAHAGSLDRLLEESDYVTIHVVLGDRSRGLLGADQLGRMKPTAYLINTSRSAIVDQKALIEALQQRAIAGAGLDVFDVEPLPADHVFRSLDNLLATPHLGYVSERNYRSYFSEAVEDIQAFLASKPIRTLS